jgi:hypothetical protein
MASASTEHANAMKDMKAKIAQRLLGWKKDAPSLVSLNALNFAHMFTKQRVLLPQNNATHPAITSALEIVLQLIKIHENL